MKKMKRGNYTSKLDKFQEFEVSHQGQEAVKGGFLFRALDSVRCSMDRSLSFLGGGNGDGDW